jgi:hypothetical protein
LMPHQVRGTQWMKGREAGRKNGGILADVSCDLTLLCLGSPLGEGIVWVVENSEDADGSRSAPGCIIGHGAR